MPQHEANPAALGELARRAQIIELRPDDVLIISNAGAISSELAARIRQAIDQARPGTKTIVFAEDINLDILRNLNLATEEQQP